MASVKEDYEGCAIEIEVENTLTLNGKKIEFTHDNTNETWHSDYLPYSQYNSLIELARAIVHESGEFTKA